MKSRNVGILAILCLAVGAMSTPRAAAQVGDWDATIAALKKQKVSSRAARRTLVFGELPKEIEQSRVDEIALLLGATALSRGARSTLAESPRGESGIFRGVLEDPNIDFDKWHDNKDAEAIAVITLPQKSVASESDQQESFRDWLREKAFSPLDVGARSWDGVKFSPQQETSLLNPRLFWQSQMFQREIRRERLAVRTASLHADFPNAGTSSEAEAGQPVPFGIYKSGALSMPRAAMSAADFDSRAAFFDLALLRDANRGREDSIASRPYFELPSGGNAWQWRRAFYGALGHGARILDLGVLAPAADKEAQSRWQEIRSSLHELSRFETIVQDGKVRPALVALWKSETGAVWRDDRAPYGLAQRQLFALARRANLPVDIVSDSDTPEILKSYRVLFLCERHISRADAQVLADWVSAGGTLLATAGAGSRDEFNQPNAIMQELLGAREVELRESGENLRTAKDLQNTVPLNQFRFNGETITALGACSVVEARGARVLASSDDDSPAILQRSHGKGRALATTFLPGLFRSETEIPALQKVLHLATSEIAPIVSCSDANVEWSVIQTSNRILIFLLNWNDKPVKNLRVEVRFIATYPSLETASGQRVKTQRADYSSVVTLDLGAADVLIFG